MYDTLQGELHWPRMTSDAYNTVKHFCSMAQARACPTRTEHFMLCQTSVPFYDFSMDVRALWAKIQQWNKHIVVIRYSSWKARTIAAHNKDQRHARFTSSSTSSYYHTALPHIYLPVSVGNFEEFFKTKRKLLWLKQITIPSFQLQMNSKSKQYDKLIILRRLHY